MLPLTKFVKLLVPKVKSSEGTCKQGERSDLTGCSPADGEASEQHEKKPASDNVSGSKPKSKLPEKLAATIRSSQFKEWFGDWENDRDNASKVADPETGEPKETHVIPRVVYHGRSRKFDAFKEGESPGVVGFFSESESYAGEYGESVEPFFLNIRKPLDLSKMGDATDRYSQTGKSVKRKVKEWFAIMQEQGVDTSKINLGDEIDEDDKVPYWGLLDSSAGNVSKSSNLITELRRQGFDGIIGREGEDNALAYAAFAPTQIKGVDNDGTFDPNDPRTAKSLSVLPECPGCGGLIKSFGDLLVCEAPDCTWTESSEVFVKSLTVETKDVGTCQQGERSDLTGCTPASGEASEGTDSAPDTNDDLMGDLRELAQRPGMRDRISRMAKIAKGALANAMLTMGDLAPIVIPNAYDHARNALLSTAVPGVPVNDIAIALSKVLAWSLKKIKAKVGKSMPQDEIEMIRDTVKILYAMLDLPEDTPLPSDEEIAETMRQRQAEKQTKTMSAYDATRGGALVGMPTPRRKLIHPSIKSFMSYRRKEVGGGTCQQGERSDLTGCTPAGKQPASKKPKAAKPTSEPKKPSRRAVSVGTPVGARLEGEGKNQRVVMADGTPAPKHITPAMIGKDWQDVKIYTDPKSDVRATGKRTNPKTGKVETKTTYRPEFAERNATIKWSRTIEGMKKYNAIQAEIQKDRNNPETKENADCSWLMQVQATRPGGEADTKGLEKLYGKKLDSRNVKIIPGEGKKKSTAEITIDGTKVILRDEGAVEQIAERLQSGGELFDSTYWLKSHGATTLEGRHVVVDENGGVSLQFMGKESVWHNHKIKDPKLAIMLIERKKKSGDAGKLFDTDYGKLSRYASKLDGGKFTAKDFRTTRANLLAVEAINSIPAPTDEKSYKAAVNEVGDRVSSVLGNDRAMALSSYIMPANFSAWRANIEQSE